MEVKELIERKQALENQIVALINEFMKVNGVGISEVSVRMTDISGYGYTDTMTAKVNISLAL